MEATSCHFVQAMKK